VIPPKLAQEELREVFALGHEQNGFEFKGPCALEAHVLWARIVRAMCGMANRRDGGRVILGVVDNPPNFAPAGLTDDQIATWTHDHLADAISTYVDPRIEFALQVQELDGRKFVLVHVEDFESQPVLCQRAWEVKDGQGKVVEAVLRKSALYIRPPGKHETREPQTAAEHRLLLDLAIEKGVVRFEALAKRAGITSGQAAAAGDDKQKFEAQTRELG
jgi:predicted HTH transcriptional regulator